MANKASCAAVVELEFEVVRGHVENVDPGGRGGGGGGGGGTGSEIVLVGRFDSYGGNRQKATLQ